MAITFGNTSTNATQGTTTWSHNSNGDFLLLGINSTSNAISGVTYNGVAMTQIGTTLNFSAIGRFFYFWGLASPASGANNIVVTGGANQNAAATSISGYSSNSGFNSGTTASNPMTVSVTTTVDSAFVVGFGAFISYSSLGTGVSDVVGGVNGDANLRMIRSTSAKSPAGSFSMSVNLTGSLLGGLIAVGINPPATGPANLKSYNTNLKANIKSIDTNLIANIKSINTNA